jgi:hypothetical protein
MSVIMVAARAADVRALGVILAGRRLLARVVLAGRRTVARSTPLRVVAVLAGFGVALLPRWLRWLPAALLAVPGPLDELAFAVLVTLVIVLRPELRRQLAGALRLAVGARHLTAAAEAIWPLG